jgi:hypothetical protein
MTNIFHAALVHKPHERYHDQNVKKKTITKLAQTAVTLTKPFTTRSTRTEIQKYRYEEMSQAIQWQASFEWIQETDESEARV